MIVGMTKALGDIPVTVKLRTGVKDGRNSAHKLMPRLSSEWGAGCITVRVSVLSPSYIMLDIRISYMGGRDSNDIRGSPIGITSGNV